MNSVTNKAAGPRVINAKIGEMGEGDKKTPIIQMVHLAPGETKDVEILNAEDPVFKGMVERGELIVGAKGERPPTSAEKAARDKADREAAMTTAKQAGYDEGHAAGYAKAVEDAKQKK